MQIRSVKLDLLKFPFIGQLSSAFMAVLWGVLINIAVVLNQSVFRPLSLDARL